MKYRILAIIVILIALMSITTYASSYEYNISPNSNFTAATSNDDLTQISQKLNMTSDELKNYFNKNGLVYLAISDDTKTQIRISCFTDNFSSAVTDMSYLSDEALLEFANAINEDKSTREIITNNDRKYIKVKDTLQDSGGIYTVTQYITICSNKTFYFIGYNQGADTSEEISQAFDSFKINETVSQTPTKGIPPMLLIIGIVVFSIIAVMMIIGIVKTILKPKGENANEY